MTTMILRNTGSTPIAIDDLGLYLEASQQVDLIGNFKDEDLIESQNLEDAITAGAVVELNSVQITYADLVNYLTKLNKYDVIDFSYISSKDTITDVTSAELEMLTNGSDASSGASSLHNHNTLYFTKSEITTNLSNTLSSYYTKTESDTNLSTALANYYTQTQIDTTLANYYTKSEVDTNLSTALASYYTRTESDSNLSTALANYYTKSEIDTNLATALDSYYTKLESDANLSTALSSYYTKTELQTSGSATVHWNNITNVPAFGSLNWKDPVATPSALPISGNELNDARMVSNDGDGKAAQYVCVATTGAYSVQWQKIADVDWGNASGIGINPNGNLASTDVQTAIYELQGDIDGIVSGAAQIDLSLDDAYNQGSTIAVDSTDVNWNIYNGRYFNINSNTKAASILRVYASASVDIVNVHGRFEQDGGSFNFEGSEASLISVANNNLTLSTIGSGDAVISSAGEITFKDANLSAAIALSEPGTSGLVGYSATSIVGALNEVKAFATGNDTLDECYDGSTGSGSGRTITADSGAVKIDASSGNYAPIELTERTTAPTQGLAAGQISVINGTLYAYDATRSKWLSVAENMYHWSERSASGKIMQIGNALDIRLGYRIPANATVVKITVWSSGGNTTKGFELRNNGSAIKSFSLNNRVYTSTNDNIDLVAGDVIQMFVSSSGAAVNDPIVTVYLKYRA